MASEITVQTIKGPTSGANANKIIVPSGQTLDASAGTLNPSAGQVVQIKQNTYSTWTTTTSTNWGSTGLTCPITPKFSTSELLVHITVAGGYLSTANEVMYLALYRDGSLVSRLDDTLGHVYAGNGISGAWTFRHTAPTTSATTYQLYWTTNNVGTIGINNYAGRIGANSNTKSTMTITEIAQ
jgi:hypothetical protein